MTDEKLTYIEEFGLFFERLGLTRMSGRVFAYMVVSDGEYSTFDEIRVALQASKGSISGTLKTLVNTGFIAPVSLPGDRKTHYKVSKIKIGDILRSRIKSFAMFAEILEKGSRLKGDRDEVSEWLDESAAFYRWASVEIEDMIVKWDSVKHSYLDKKEETS